MTRNPSKSPDTIICDKCGNEVPLPASVEVERSNPYGDKTWKVRICMDCYSIQEKRNLYGYLIAGIGILLMGLFSLVATPYLIYINTLIQTTDLSAFEAASMSPLLSFIASLAAIGIGVILISYFWIKRKEEKKYARKRMKIRA